MITTISIRGHKSYHPTEPHVIPLETSTQKPVFVYGVNGSGKSAIGEVIHGRYVNDPAFDACRVTTTGTGPFRYRVYNQDFVESVIGESEGMPGIFTIGELDTATQKEIELNEGLSKEIEGELTAIEGQKAVVLTALDDLAKTAREEVWKAYKAHSQGKLKHLLVGYGRDMAKFFDDLRGFEVGDDVTLDSLEQLEQRWEDVSGQEATKSMPTVRFAGFSLIEGDEVWQEAIAVSAESRLAPLIEKWGHSDWVNDGRRYVHDNQCPFCQQGLPPDFAAELAKLLDGNRQKRVDLIAAHIGDYERLRKQLEDDIGEALAEPLAKDTGLQDAWAGIEVRLKDNLAKMRAKQERPATPVALDATDAGVVQDALAKLKSRIEEFNKRIANRASERDAIKKMFWQMMCRDRLSTYKVYYATRKSLDEKNATLDESVQRARTRAREVTLRLGELRRQQTGVDAAVEAINDRLKQLGIDAFWIERKAGEGSLYALGRPGQGGGSAQSLSEGEKTLISFLYFMELLHGSEKEDGLADLEKTIVVIDDPISSLSQNYVYDIASIIHHELIRPPAGAKKVRQVMVLTHNLFFLHELVYLAVGRKSLHKAKDICQLLRVVKSGHSKVIPLDAKDIANDYDALWQVLRDARDQRLPIQVVPNTMRCVLEHFFSFTGRDGEFEEVLAKISAGDNRFKPLERYLNRGSHKGGVNTVAMDWGQYDLAYYLAKLRAVFQAVNFEDHYLSKMGEAVR